MKKFLQEFRDFALRGNVMDMAIGIIIGAAFSDIVTSLTDNFITPILLLITQGARYTLADVAGFASNFLSAVVNFIIMAFILFCLMRAVNKALDMGKKKEAPAEPTTKECPYCKSQIPILATKCAHCTSDVE
jgi:large conductance mechanosensitive channel